MMLPPEAAKRDRLSALPDDILHRILRFVDARECVGTLSLLSRRWRHLWSSSPYFTMPVDISGDEVFGNRMLLLRDNAPLLTFSLHTATDSPDFVYQRRWMRHALIRGLRVLEVEVCCNRYFELPDCVFTCETLEVISLSAGERGVLSPKSVRLPRLKKLHLSEVEFNDASFAKKLSSGCPALEDLSFSFCSFGWFKISSDTVKALSITWCRYKGIYVYAPNACSLRLTVLGEVQLDGMPSLVSAWVCLREKRLARRGYDIMATLCNVQKLELLGFGSVLQDMMEKSDNRALQFSNLKSLIIEEDRVSSFYSTFAYFLRFAPNLAYLTFDRWNMHQSDPPETGFIFEEERHIKNSCKLMNLVSGLHRDVEVLRIRLSKEQDSIEECHKLRGFLKEKIKAKEMIVVWF
ncbi:unnamed protein product [Urochloa decumbens]|uniref:F-box domain-containing protein n=1 Tax=Urochloa decumbens TaxID=240449 RepID=A0ABC9A1J1_9POAL